MSAGDDDAIHPVDAFAEQAGRLFPNEPLSQETLDRMRVYMDEPVDEPHDTNDSKLEQHYREVDQPGNASDGDPADLTVAITTADGKLVEEVVSPNVMALIEIQAKRIADLEAMNEAQRTLTERAEAELELQKEGERMRRLPLEQTNRYRKLAIESLIDALVPFARFASDEADGQIRGMTEPVCLSMAAVHRADALVKLYQALR